VLRSYFFVENTNMSNITIFTTFFKTDNITLIISRNKSITDNADLNSFIHSCSGVKSLLNTFNVIVLMSYRFNVMQLSNLLLMTLWREILQQEFQICLLTDQINFDWRKQSSFVAVLFEWAILSIIWVLSLGTEH
jgi:hypothetical protein